MTGEAKPAGLMALGGSPRLLLILSMVIFGTVGLVVRAVPLPSAEIALWRAVLAATALLVYTLWRGKPLRKKAWRGTGPLLLSGVLMGLNWAALFEAYRYTSISAATLAYYTAPLMVTALSALLLKERLSGQQLVFLCLALLGLVFIISPGGVTSRGHLVGVLLGLLAAGMYALVVMINRFLGDIPGVQRTLLQFLAAIGVLLPYNLLGGELQLLSMPPAGWAALLLLGLLHTAATYLLYFGAIRLLKGHEIAVLSYIDPLVAVLCSTLFLGERMGAVQVVGGVIILVAAFMSPRFAAKAIET